jgi:hypothetical protein
MAVRIEPDLLRSQSRGDVRKPKMNITPITAGHGVGQLIFMEIDQQGGMAGREQGPHIGQTEHVGRHNQVDILKRRKAPGHLQRGAAHTPFPEAVGKGDQFDPVARVALKSLGKGAMGASEKGFQKEDPHISSAMTVNFQ